MDVFLEHVRSFAGGQTVPLAPLTLLVGENSAGKTTFLSVVASILKGPQFPLFTSFNDPPFHMGTFETIATYKGGKYGRDTSFSIGFSTGARGTPEYRSTRATYGSTYGEVRLRQVETVGQAGTLAVELGNAKLVGQIVLSSPKNKRFDFEYELPAESVLSDRPFQLLLLDAIFDRRQVHDSGSAGVAMSDEVLELIQSVSLPPSDSRSLAPIRSRPERTYDELKTQYTPGGDHVPALLARLLREEPDSEQTKRVVRALLTFGAASGLYKKVTVKKLGKSISDPFQLQVSVVGPPVNMTDVGYGVSQSLPIVVQSSLRAERDVLLMQQPEVHLHPRAQAALGTFFAELISSDEAGRMVLIETHSDYLVDRIRLEVARGKLKPEAVCILFFDKPSLETTVHALSLDESGNVLNAPQRYRSFFLKEELDLFNRTSH